MIYLNKKNRISQGAALIGAAFFALALHAQEYVMDPDWPKPLPENIEWGQVPNVTIDREGFIYAFHRLSAGSCAVRSVKPVLMAFV